MCSCRRAAHGVSGSVDSLQRCSCSCCRLLSAERLNYINSYDINLDFSPLVCNDATISLTYRLHLRYVPLKNIFTVFSYWLVSISLKTFILMKKLKYLVTAKCNFCHILSSNPSSAFIHLVSLQLLTLPGQRSRDYVTLLCPSVSVCVNSRSTQRIIAKPLMRCLR